MRGNQFALPLRYKVDAHDRLRQQSCAEMTTANKITIARILLVPVFVVQLLYYMRSGDDWNRIFALIAFALAAISDGLDGYIARHYNQRSELGTILDPLADKLLLVSAVILLSLDSSGYLTRIPLWLTVLIISRDVLVPIGVFVVHHLCGKVALRPRIAGKVATVFQIGVVLWILLQWSEKALGYWIFSAAFFTTLSFIIYMVDGVRKLNASPVSAATKNQ